MKPGDFVKVIQSNHSSVEVGEIGQLLKIEEGFIVKFIKDVKLPGMADPEKERIVFCPKGTIRGAKNNLPEPRPSLPSSDYTASVQNGLTQ